MAQKVLGGRHLTFNVNKGKKIMVKMRKTPRSRQFTFAWILNGKIRFFFQNVVRPIELESSFGALNGHKWDTGRIVYLDLFLYSINKRCWLPDPLDFSRLALLGRSLPLPRFPSHSALHLAEMGTCRKLIRFSSFVKSSPFWVLYFINNFNVSCYPPFRN